MSRSPAKHKLALILSAVILASFVATSLINYFMARNDIRDELLHSSLPLTMDTIYSEIQADLIRPVYVSSLMANDTFLKDWALSGEEDVAKVTAYLREIKKKYSFFTAFFVSEKSRNYYHHDGILKKITPTEGHDVWYARFIDSGRRWVLDVDTNEAAHDTLTIFINHRISDGDGNLLGVTGVGLDMTIVSEMITRYGQKYGRNVFLVDREGLIKAHAELPLASHASMANLPGMCEASREVLRAGPGVPVEVVYDRDGRDYLLTARYIPEFDWILVVEQDEGAALGTARRNLAATLFVGLFASLLVIMITVGAVNRFNNRLERLAGQDELTGLANRREFERLFLQARARCERRLEPLSLILVDIDDFKAVNDTFGHVRGDELLREVGGLILRNVRREDVVARWGGDEFLILAECTRERARQLSDRICCAVGDLAMSPAWRVNGSGFGVSCGVGIYQTGEGLEEFLARADRDMYAAKRAKACPGHDL